MKRQHHQTSIPEGLAALGTDAEQEQPDGEQQCSPAPEGAGVSPPLLGCLEIGVAETINRSKDFPFQVERGHSVDIEQG